MKNNLWIGLVVTAAVLTARPAAAQIELSDAELVAGRVVRVSLPQPDTQLVITYRPHSSVVRRDTLRAPAPARDFSWTPARPGVVSVSGGGAARNVSVRFAGGSPPGVVVLLLAGGILFGGAGLAFRNLMGKG